MICSAYFGELSNERKENWHYEDTDPYSVLSSSVSLEGKEHRVLEVGNQYFHDIIKLDWGSFAWKCTTAEMINFLEDNKTTFSWLVRNDEQLIERIRHYILERGNVDYGVLFVEEG